MNFFKSVLSLQQTAATCRGTVFADKGTAMFVEIFSFFIRKIGIGAERKT